MEKTQINPTWYAVLVERGTEREMRAEIALYAQDEQIAHDISVPLLYTFSARNSVSRSILMPGYVFVMLHDVEHLYCICRSVTKIEGYLHRIGDPLTPAAIGESEMYEFLERVDQTNLDYLRPRFKKYQPDPKTKRPDFYNHPDVGSKVKLDNGIIGTIAETKDAASIVLFEFFGRMIQSAISKRTPLQAI